MQITGTVCPKKLKGQRENSDAYSLSDRAVEKLVTLAQVCTVIGGYEDIIFIPGRGEKMFDFVINMFADMAEIFMDLWISRITYRKKLRKNSKETVDET